MTKKQAAAVFKRWERRGSSCAICTQKNSEGKCKVGMRNCLAIRADVAKTFQALRVLTGMEEPT